MLRRKQRTRFSTNQNNSIFNKLKKNFLKILLLTMILFMIISIVDYNFGGENSIHVDEENRKKIKEHNLEKIYMQKNLKHNEVRIWVLNNTDEDKLAAKIRECLEKGYNWDASLKEPRDIRGDYTIFKQDNFGRNDQFHMGFINEEYTKIFIHNKKAEFKTHIQEFLSFTGFESDIIKENYDKELNDERDITIILGKDWNNSNLEYCGEIRN